MALFTRGRFIKGIIKDAIMAGNKDAIIRTVLLIVLLIGPRGPKNSPLVYQGKNLMFGEL